jgi:hypothetical protein
VANPLARQMLNNLARKAGQEIPAEGNRTADSSAATVRLDKSEEQLLVDLIHLRQKLNPEKTPVKSDSGLSSESSRHGMLSLAELAAKARYNG